MSRLPNLDYCSVWLHLINISAFNPYLNRLCDNDCWLTLHYNGCSDDGCRNNYRSRWRGWSNECRTNYSSDETRPKIAAPMTPCRVAVVMVWWGMLNPWTIVMGLSMASWSRTSMMWRTICNRAHHNNY